MNKLVVITDALNEQTYAVVAYNNTLVKAFPVSQSSEEWTEWVNESAEGIDDVRESLDYTLQAEFPRPTTDVELLHLEDTLSPEHFTEFKSLFGESTLELVDAVHGHGRRFASKSFESDLIDVASIPLTQFKPESRQAAIEYKGLTHKAENRFSTTFFEAKGARALWDPNLGPSGGWRCPEGSQFGGYITDRFGRGCGGGILRRIGRSLVNAGRRLDNIGESRGKRRLERAAERAQRGTQAGRAQRAGARAANALERGAQRLVGEYQPRDYKPGDGGRLSRRNVGKPKAPDKDRESEINARLTDVAAELDELVDQPPTPEIEKRIRELEGENRALRAERDGLSPKRISTVAPVSRPRRVLSDDAKKRSRTQGKTPVKKPVAEQRREGVLERAARRLVGDYDPSEYKPGDKKRIKDRENRYARVTDDALLNALNVNKPGNGKKDEEANKRQERLEVLQEMLNRGIDIPEEYKKEVKQYRLKKQRQQRGKLTAPPKRDWRPGEPLGLDDKRRLKEDIDKRSRKLSDAELDAIIERGPRRDRIDGNVRAAEAQRLEYDAAMRERNRRARGGKREDEVELPQNQLDELNQAAEEMNRNARRIREELDKPRRDDGLIMGERVNRAAQALEDAAQRVLDADKRRERKNQKKERRDAFREIMQDIFRERRVRKPREGEEDRKRFEDYNDANLRRALNKLRRDRDKYNDDEDKQKRIDDTIKALENELETRNRLRAEASQRLGKRRDDMRERQRNRREERRNRRKKPEQEEAPEAPVSQRERTRTAVSERGASTPIRRPQPKRQRGEKLDAFNMSGDERKRFHDILGDEKRKLDAEWRKRLGLGENDEVTSRAIKDYIKKQEADGKPNAFIGKLRADANDWDVISEHQRNIAGRPPGAHMPGDENELVNRIGPKRRKEIADAFNAGAPKPKTRSRKTPAEQPDGSPQRRSLNSADKRRLDGVVRFGRKYDSKDDAKEVAKKYAKRDNKAYVVARDNETGKWQIVDAEDLDKILDDINNDSAAQRYIGEAFYVSPSASPASAKPESENMSFNASESARVSRSIEAVTESIGGSVPDERSKRNVRNRFPNGGLPDKAFWRDSDWEPRAGGDDREKHEKRFGRYYDADGNINARGRLVNRMIEKDKGTAGRASTPPASAVKPKAPSVVKPKADTVVRRFRQEKYAEGWDSSADESTPILRFWDGLDEGDVPKMEQQIAVLNEQIQELAGEYKRVGNLRDLGEMDRLILERDYMEKALNGYKNNGMKYPQLDFGFINRDDKFIQANQKRAIDKKDSDLAQKLIEEYDDMLDNLNFLVEVNDPDIDEMMRGRARAKAERIKQEQDRLKDLIALWEAERPTEPSPVPLPDIPVPPGDLPEVSPRRVGKKEYSEEAKAIKHIQENGGDLADIPDELVLTAVLAGAKDGDGFQIDIKQALRRGFPRNWENARFKGKRIKGGGRDRYLWEVHKVTDKKTGDVWFFKTSDYGTDDGLMEMIGAGAAEVLEFGNRRDHLRVGPWQKRKVRDGRWVMMRDIGQMDHGANIGSDVEWLDAGQAGLDSDEQARIDVRDAARMAVLDLVLKNEDRHGGNFQVGRAADGRIRLGIIDMGLILGGRAPEDYGLDTDEYLDGLGVVRVRDYRNVINNGLDGLEMLGFRLTEERDRQKFAAQARRAAERMRDQIDTILGVDTLQENGVKLTPQELAHVEAARRFALGQIDYLLNRGGITDLVRELSR